MQWSSEALYAPTAATSSFSMPNYSARAQKLAQHPQITARQLFAVHPVDKESKGQWIIFLKENFLLLTFNEASLKSRLEIV